MKWFTPVLLLSFGLNKGSGNEEEGTGSQEGGTSPIEEFCTDFELGFEEVHPEFIPDCTCSGSVNGAHTATCRQRCEGCIDDICTNVISNYFFYKEDNGAIQHCATFTNGSFNNEEHCVYYDYVDEFCEYTVDGNDCGCEFQYCSDDDGNQRAAYIAHCADVGYEDNIDICQGTTGLLPGPFQFFHDINPDTYTPGTCPDDGQAERTTEGARSAAFVVAAGASTSRIGLLLAAVSTIYCYAFSAFAV